jgi:predicted TIM-barrel fold metal-dependent hydrolase
MRGLPYIGFKIHPKANVWDLEDAKTVALARQLFAYANERGMSICIHTGYDPLDEANKFSGFFADAPNAQIILAHGRPIEQTLDLMKKFRNVFCDTAFMPASDQEKVANAGLAGKMLFGSDLPITQWYAKEPRPSLVEQYRMDRPK